MKSKLFSILLIPLLFSLTACEEFVNGNGIPKKDETSETDQNQTGNDGQKEDFIDVFDDGKNNNETEPNNNDGNNTENNNDNNGGNTEPPEEHTDPVVLSSISITNPTKLVYEAGDELDLTGLVVTASYSDDSKQQVSLDDISITGYDMSKIGEQTVVITYEGKTASFKITVLKKYDESPDSVENINTSDLSALYNVFNTPILNYTSKTESFFNKVGAYDYYRHYQKNYVQEKTGLFTESSQYTYPKLNEYLEIMNTGYLNLNNNYYSYSLSGDDVESRLASTLSNDDLTLVKENSSYQDDMFTLSDLNQTYFENNDFVRVSANKYQSTKGKDTYNDFISICAPNLINEGYYMTFSKVTIELNPMENVSFRIRLYASTTQSGKLIDIHKDQENRPNWYMLFSEALVYDVGTTTFHPVESLL